MDRRCAKVFELLSLGSESLEAETSRELED